MRTRRKEQTQHTAERFTSYTLRSSLIRFSSSSFLTPTILPTSFPPFTKRNVGIACTCHCFDTSYNIFLFPDQHYEAKIPKSGTAHIMSNKFQKKRKKKYPSACPIDRWTFLGKVAYSEGHQKPLVIQVRESNMTISKYVLPVINRISDATQLPC